jgi:hypothetical protein
VARRLTILTLISALLLGAPGFAEGWSNGRRGPDSFGTHDWVLHRAAKAISSELPWLRLRVALRATDDPDMRDGIDHASGTWWHVWDEWGATYGGAPEAVRVWMRRAERRRAAGRFRSASRAVGFVAHLVGDVAQPMHTDSTDREERVHSSYEVAVDGRSERGDDFYVFRFDGVDPARPYASTVAVARRAHLAYGDLVRNYDNHGYNRAVHRISKRQLNRGANALADLLATLGPD